MVRDKLQRKVNAEFQKWVAETETLFDRTCHDKISKTQDKIDRHLVLRYIMRWVIEELSEFNTPEQMDVLRSWQLVGDRAPMKKGSNYPKTQDCS